MDVAAEDAQKKAYAALLLNEPDPYKAAFCLFPGNTNRAILVASQWPSDQVVIEEQTRLRTEVAANKPALPSKHDLAKVVWERMKGTPDDEAFVKLAKLYGEVNGFIEKPQPSQTNVNIQQNRVMTVRDFGTEENWETKMLDQQRKLQNGEFNAV